MPWHSREDVSLERKSTFPFPSLESGLAGEPDISVQDDCRPTSGCREQGVMNTGGPTLGAQGQPEGAASQEGRREQT